MRRRGLAPHSLTFGVGAKMSYSIPIPMPIPTPMWLDEFSGFDETTQAYENHGSGNRRLAAHVHFSWSGVAPALSMPAMALAPRQSAIVPSRLTTA